MLEGQLELLITPAMRTWSMRWKSSTTQSFEMRFRMDMSGLENMIQGRILGVLAGEDPILRAAAAAVDEAWAEAGAEAGAGAEVPRQSLHVGPLQNLHQDLLAPARSQGHRLQEDRVQDQDLLYLLFRRKEARALASQVQPRVLSTLGVHRGKMGDIQVKREERSIFLLLKTNSTFLKWIISERLLTVEDATSLICTIIL